MTVDDCRNPHNQGCHGDVLKKFPNFLLTFPSLPTQIPVTVVIHIMVIFCNKFKTIQKSHYSSIEASHNGPEIGQHKNVLNITKNCRYLVLNLMQNM